MNSLILLNNVSKRYASNSVLALDKISLSFKDKGFYSIVGESGSGKTTLLNILGTIDKPTSGNIYISGIDVVKSDNSTLDKIRSSLISFSFQDNNLIKNFTVFQNISLGLEVQSKKRDFIKEKIEDTLKKVGLEGYENRKISQLSGGQIQRVSIARAIARESKILLCDEPTANLDEKTSKQIFSILKEISKNVLVILVTHNRQLANEFSDEIIEIDSGHLISSTIKSKNCEELIETSTKAVFIKKPKLSLKSLFKVFINNLKMSKISCLLSFLILSILLAICTSIFSLKYNSETNSYINSFKTNNQYIVSTTLLRDSNEKFNKTEYFGSQLYYEVVSEEDEEILKQQISEDRILKTYFYNVSFSAFSDNQYEDLSNFSNSFKRITTVKDFSNFSQPLKSGSLPSKDNEILIYDYVEDSLIEHGIIEGNAVNKSLYNHVNNHSFIIKGVLKSNYKNLIVDEYSYSDSDKYRNIHLSELETIFCTEEFFKTLSDNHLIAVNNIYISNNIQTVEYQPYVTGSRVVEYKNMDLLNNDMSFDYLTEVDSDSYGFIISKKLAMEFSGYSNEAEFDNATFGTEYNGSKAFYETYSINIEYYDYSKVLSASNKTYVGFLIGISNDLDKDEILFINDNPITYDNLSFRNFDIMLDKNWKENRKIIDSFKWKEKDESYFESIPDGEEIYSFTFYDPLSALLTSSKRYVPKIINVVKKIALAITILALLVEFYFVFSLIKNDTCKIGIFKSLGLSNTQIIFTYIFHCIVLLLGSILISIPVSTVIINAINVDFLETLGSIIKVFNFELYGFNISLIIGTLVLIAGIAVPLILLSTKTPLELIRKED